MVAIVCKIGDTVDIDGSLVTTVSGIKVLSLNSGITISDGGTICGDNETVTCSVVVLQSVNFTVVASMLTFCSTVVVASVKTFSTTTDSF